MIEVLVEGRDAEAMTFGGHLHILETCRGKQRPQSRFAEREQSVGSSRLRGDMACDDGIYPSVVGSLWHRVDGYSCIATRTKYAAKLGEATCRIGKKHQAQTAQNRVKAVVRQAQRLAILHPDRDVVAPDNRSRARCVICSEMSVA